MDDDDYFSVDDLNDLAEEDFQALENAAVLASTQQQARSQTLPLRTTVPVVKPPWSGRTGISREEKEAQEARAAYLAKQQERHRLQQQQAQQRLQEQYQQGQQGQHHGRSQSHNYYVTAQQQSRQQQLTATAYVTLPTLPSSPLHRGGVARAHPGNHINGYGQDNQVEQEEYDNFEERAELWDAAQPTEVATEPLQNIGAYQTTMDQVQAQERAYNDYNNRNYVLHEEVDNDAQMEEEQVHGDGHPVEDPEEMTRMRLIVQQLLEEKSILQQERDTLKDQVTTKLGEASILRSNLAKDKEVHERTIASIKAIHAEDQERHKRELEDLRQEKERIQIESAFLQSDAHDVSRQNKMLAKTRKAVLTLPKGERDRVVEGPVTPRKHRSRAFRDGFNDEEMHAGPSTPTKSGGKHRGSPAKPGSKRKRRPDDSPTMSFAPLPLSQGDIPALPNQESVEEIEETLIQHIDDNILEKLTMKDKRYEYFKAITSYRQFIEEPPIFEILSHFKFPDDTPSFSTLILDQISIIDNDTNTSSFPAGVCEILLCMWERCYNLEFFDPLSYIIELLDYAILYDLTGHVMPAILDHAIDIIQQTVGFAFVHFPMGEVINVSQCLNLLRRLALGVGGNDRLIRRFWKTLPMGFTKQCLELTRNIGDIQLMASILTTATRPDSIGNIVENEVDQRKNEKVMLDQMGKLLRDTPKFGLSLELHAGQKRIMLTDMRIQVVKALAAFCRSPLGAHMIALNINLVSKLCVQLGSEMDFVYGSQYGVRKSVEFLNMGMRVLHGILILEEAHHEHYGDPSEPTLIQKFMGTDVTTQTQSRHLVLLARIAFMEANSPLLDMGLGTDVVRAAKDLLERSITIEEGQALEKMFVLPANARSRSVSGNGSGSITA